MKTLTEHLAQYAAYHRDRRNIASHFVGVPLILYAVAALLSRPQLEGFGIAWSPALIAGLALAVFYFRLDLRFGAVMAALLALALWGGARLAAWDTASWLGVAAGMFVVGWIVQFVGHYHEGRKPAFVDDLVGLAVGPLFVVAELAFLLGLRKDLARAVEALAGPVRGAGGRTA
ncbi:Mpo1-like protein [Pseudomonas sp. RIT-PI-AD]|uniref:Mpo1 family 2-hydroxy fatty acid dioxygenase n=1 Tax=Pseudomonas sp. RIT-PI-AD TaxID=3035294 RepID=UPI0021DA4F86|nr:Mpo1-like protein [Pseudomonas sp. RIT-PI-AD]